MSKGKEAAHGQVLHRVRVPSSTSNLGSGFDCLGLALDFWLDVAVVEGAGNPTYSGTLASLSPAEDFLMQALADTLRPNTHVEVQSTIPVSRGLGSSAAARVAGLVLARLARGSEIDRDSVFADAVKEEGHPDNAGPAVYGGLVLQAGSPTVLELHESLAVALALPGRQVSTDTARAILPPRLSREEAISQASRAAALLLGLTNGDGQLVKYGMIDVIAAPYRARLITGFDDAVRAALDAGAFGATVSGAGSGIVSICARGNASTVADAMVAALAGHDNAAESATPGVVRGGFQIAG